VFTKVPAGLKNYMFKERSAQISQMKSAHLQKTNSYGVFLDCIKAPLKSGAVGDSPAVTRDKEGRPLGQDMAEAEVLEVNSTGLP
jgi:hypothetical protein